MTRTMNKQSIFWGSLICLTLVAFLPSSVHAIVLKEVARFDVDAVLCLQVDDTNRLALLENLDFHIGVVGLNQHLTVVRHDTNDLWPEEITA